MTEIIAILIGCLLVFVGVWILFLRFEGLVDRFFPRHMSIGRMTVDGVENKAYAELLRARFDHYFRRPPAVPKETGFLDVVTFDSSDLFQPPKSGQSAADKVDVEVSGVNVSRLFQFASKLAKPDEWIVEGDFQAQSDRALLALRLRRGGRLIRTWYLERRGSPDDEQLLEQLIDDALFQLVYDFWNEGEQDGDIRRWRDLVKRPKEKFPSRTAVAAYFEGVCALGAYYADGDWEDLDRAVESFQDLRSQMPEYDVGLQLLGIALAEKRKESDAIHVLEQLQLQLLSPGTDWSELEFEKKLQLLSVDLLKATATAKLDTWQSAHEAIRDLLQLDQRLQEALVGASTGDERAAYTELRAQTAVQLANTYALYLPYLLEYRVSTVLGNPAAPEALKVSEPNDLRALGAEGSPSLAKQIVRRQIAEAVRQHESWIAKARDEHANLDFEKLDDGERRKTEFNSRLHLVSGVANFRMAEWEHHDAEQGETVLGKSFQERIEAAEDELRQADAAHPGHYRSLQMLGLVFAEPRRKDGNLSIAEHYFERAIAAKPTDYYSHQLLASVLLRRVANRGVDVASLATIRRGLDEARKAIELHESSAEAHLLRAEFQAMLLEIEQDKVKRQELAAGLDQYVAQANRFLLPIFERPHPDLSWIRIVAATRRLEDEAEAVTSPPTAAPDVQNDRLQRFTKSKQQLEADIDELIAVCTLHEQRWVAHKRVFHVTDLKNRAIRLKNQVQGATPDNWRRIQIEFH